MENPATSRIFYFEFILFRRNDTFQGNVWMIIFPFSELASHLPASRNSLSKFHPR